MPADGAAQVAPRWLLSPTQAAMSEAQKTLIVWPAAAHPTACSTGHVSGVTPIAERVPPKPRSVASAQPLADVGAGGALPHESVKLDVYGLPLAGSPPASTHVFAGTGHWLMPWHSEPTLENVANEQMASEYAVSTALPSAPHEAL